MTHDNRITRRQWLHGTGSLALAMSAGGALAKAEEPASPGTRAGKKLRVGMCDWSIGKWDPGVMELGRRIGLDGIEVSLGKPGDIRLARPEVQQKFLEVCKEQDMAIPSVAVGMLNDVPLIFEPRAAVWVVEAIDAAAKLSARNLLLAFFSKGELREGNADDMRRVTEVLAELAPRAERAGVVLGIESYLTAEAHLKIIEAVKSKSVAVYYDVFNAAHRKHDVVSEIRLLGPRICQVHLKEGDEHLGASGRIDWPAVAAALHEVHYRGWLVLETSSPTDVVTDTRANVEYVRKVFAPLAAPA